MLMCALKTHVKHLYIEKIKFQHALNYAQDYAQYDIPFIHGILTCASVDTITFSIKDTMIIKIRNVNGSGVGKSKPCSL